ncbi:MAG: S8 family serine peptidase, partial [Planctomycetes bacterium]|nr:S8 family serine peptidase [Planctomycetota bacterium]
TQQAKLTASDGYSSDLFGYSVSIDGDTVIVGAHQNDDNGSNSGSAYIFQRNGTIWTQQAKLTASDGYSSDLFGSSVSIDGDTVIVGAHQNDDNGSNSGSAYIFQRNGTIWTQQAKLTASDGYSSDLFGSSVSIDGDTVIAGAYGDDDNGSESGSAYIYEKTGGSWTNATETVKLVSRDGAIGDRFGYSVGISNGLSVIGAYYDDDQGTDSGSAYVFGSVDPLHIEAAVLPKDFISSGDEGGPFAPSTKTYILTNNDVDTLNWTASVYQSWLDIAPAAGTLAAGASVTLEVTLNAGVNSLAPGNYNDSIVFSNTTSGQAQSRLVRLDVLVVPGEIEVVDSIPEPNMPFGDVIIGLTATETITIKNVDPDHALVISQIGNFVDFEGFFEEFTSTTLDPSKWTVSSGVPQIDSIGINEPSEPYSLRLNGTPGGTESIESVPMDFSGASDLVLVYWYEQTGGGESPDSGEDLVIECWNGSSWIELDRQLGSGPDMSNYVQRIIPLPAAAMHLEFKLKIEKSSGSSCNCDDWFVDDVSIVHIDQIGSVVDVGATPTSPVIELDQPFKLENIPPMPLSLPPLGEITFDVLFEPLDKEDYEYELTIISDDRDEPEINLTLSGSGIDDYLEVSPEDAVSFTGHPGGPFMPSSQSYQLTNTGPIDVDWGADPNMPWISVTPASGRLKVGESTTVTIEWTPAARQLPPGGHRDILNITNLTTTLNYERTVIVDVYTEAKVMTSPLFFDVSTPYATLLPEVLTIGNTGDAALEYSVRAILDDYTPFSEQGSQGEQMQTMSPEYSVHEEMDLTVVNGTSPFVEREVLVRFAQVASMDAVDSTWLDNILAQMGGAEIKRHYSLVPGLKLVTLPDEITVEQALVDYSTLDGVQYVQPNYEVNTNQTIPNDSYFADLWGMHNTGQAGGMVNADINAPEAWDISTGSEDVIVAVIDTGIDYGHPDLIDNTWINYPEYNGTAGVDDDGNGYIDDIYGYDFAYKDSDPYDGHYHGTHCAGTIGAAGDNAQGVAGVCWKVKLMAVKFLNDSGSGYDSDAIDSIEYAVSMGARIMSCSWGGGSYNQGLKDAIDAAGAAGVILVAAAGNDNSNNNIYPHYPSSYDCTNIIAVMSTDRYDSRSSFSCYGSTSVDVGAPGSDIYSCSPGNSYRYLNGTSMATPHVSGACALMLSRNSALSVPEIKDILFNTVDQTLPGQCVSEGRMNVYEALLEVPVQSGGVGGTWIQFSSSSGIIAPDDANDIELTFDAGRNPGIYTGRILLTSNDPYSPEITMPVTFTVEAVDYCTQIFDPNGNDLSYQSFVFKKGSFGNYYTACRIPVTDFPVDPNGGVTINLQDDDYVRVDLISKLFNFYGNDYDHFYVGSNGYLTFGSGDFFHVESLDYHFTLPRISALFDDLDPTAGGQVSYKQLDDRIAVTYQDISEFGMPGLNSFQIEMLIDGTIRITCLEISAEDGLIGLSEGDGLSPLFFESDFSQYEACDFKSDLNHDLRSNLSDFSIFSGFWLMEEYPIATIRDEFNAVSYDGNDGMQNWSTDWQETGEPDGPTAGVVMVLEDGSLRVGDLSKKKLPAIALARQVNISSATTALLTFDYTIQSDSNKGEILVQASNDGGVYWDTLDTFTPSAGSGSAQYDFTSYISDYAGIRFRIEEDQRFEMYMYIDNVQLEFDSFDAPWYSWSNGSDIDQNFIVDFNDLMIFIDHWLE